MLPKVARVLAALLLWSVVQILAQTPDSPAPAQPAPKPQFFAGTVTELDDQHVTVSRTLIGHPPETRTFLVRSNTKMNKGALKVKARVTVRYQHEVDGDVALEIRIHSSTAAPAKPS
jgi:hypothetical protein